MVRQKSTWSEGPGVTDSLQAEIHLMHKSRTSDTKPPGGKSRTGDTKPPGAKSRSGATEIHLERRPRSGVKSQQVTDSSPAETTWCTSPGLVILNHLEPNTGKVRQKSTFIADSRELALSHSKNPAATGSPAVLVVQRTGESSELVLLHLKTPAATVSPAVLVVQCTGDSSELVLQIISFSSFVVFAIFFLSDMPLSMVQVFKLFGVSNPFTLC